MINQYIEVDLYSAQFCKRMMLLAGCCSNVKWARGKLNKKQCFFLLLYIILYNFNLLLT